MSLLPQSQVYHLDNKHRIFRRFYHSSKKVQARTKRVICFHDFFDYHQNYTDLPEYFFTKNISFNFDLIDMPSFGFSRSNASFSMKLVEDGCIEALKSFKFLEHESVYLLGQGLGGLVALSMLLRRNLVLSKPLAGVILINPMLKMKANNSSFNFLTKAFKCRGSMLTSDKIKVNEYDSDFLNRKKMSFSERLEIDRWGYELRSQAYFVKTPTLCLLSGQDHVTDNDFTKLFLRGIDKSLISVREYSSAKHDLINEVDRVAIYSDIFHWIK